MKVLKLTPFYHHPDVVEWPASYDSVGGMQIQTWRQSVWLARAGVAQDVVTIGFPGLPKVRALLPNLHVRRALTPLPKIRSEFSGLLGLTQSWALATIAFMIGRARRHDYDLIHAHFDGQIPALLVSWLAPTILGRPMVITVHCSRLAVYTPHSLIDRIQHGLARWLEKRALAKAHTVMALTRKTAVALGEASGCNVVIAPDAVDTSEFTRPPEAVVADFRRRHRLRGRTVGFIGRIAKEKGWVHLIPLARELRKDGVGLLLVGDGPQRDRMQAAVDEAGLGDCVTITGFIPNDEVPAALAACELIVMPSMYEEFGGASIEAFSVGTPVVAFAVGGLQEIVGGITPELLVPHGDTEALIGRVREVLSGAHAERIGPERLRAQVEQRFSPDAVFATALEAYAAAVGSTRQGPGQRTLGDPGTI